MQDLFSKCGANCGRCPAYRENVRTDADRQRCSDGWHKYLGARLNVQRCYCDGCQTPDDESPVLVYGKYGCKIRRCAVFNGVGTCAHCSAYPCEEVRTQFSFDSESREKLAARLGTPIPEDEYLTFIEPYELHKHLDEIRTSLAPEDIVEMTPVSVKPEVTRFPNDLPFSQEPFKALHRLLAGIGAVEGIPHVRLPALKERRRHLLKVLWTFGRFGEPSEEGGSHLVIDSQTYLAQKIQSSYSRVKSYFKALEEYGVRCEHVPLVEEGWLTPKGALRKGGWFMKLSFGEDAGGAPALKALQSYTAKLHEEYGKRAFRYFSRADMRVLSQEYERSSRMKKLENLNWGPRWVSHLGCVKGCLDYLGLNVSDAWLFGATGHAFVLNVHEVVCPSGPTAWNTEMLPKLGKNIGYETDDVFGMKSADDFGERQKLAWEHAKAAIDQGLPCYGWELDIPEYYVVYGYDDAGYYFSGPGCDEGRGPKPWRELGDTEIGVIEMYSVKPGRAADDVQTVKEGLAFALEHATSPSKWIFPKYKAGLDGYDAWVHALEIGTADGFGMGYNAAVWAECRGYAVLFLKEAQKRLDGRAAALLDEAMERYQVVHENLQTVADAFPFHGMEPEHIRDPVRLRTAMEALQAARDAEADGLETLRRIANEL